MSTKDQALNQEDLSGISSITNYKIHIAVSDWNSEITQVLLDGAKSTLIKLGADPHDIHIVHVPGTFELPVAAKALLSCKSADAVICLGCVIKGETEHDMFINQSVANALNQLAIMSGKPITFGVLTVNNLQQAKDRAGGKYGNKGTEAAITAAKMVHLHKELEKPGGKIGF